MTTPDTPIYRKAFENYLRKGIPPEIYIKALGETLAGHTTPIYCWRTAGDDKVRHSHAANNNKVFALHTRPPTGHPGEEPGCRCRADPYYGFNEPPLEPVYPELLFIPLLKIPRLIASWRAWRLTRQIGKGWQLSKDKSDVKWANQIKQGNWTPEKIDQTIRNGTAHKAINKKTEGPATRYQLGDRFVVRDNTTGDIIQVSRPNMKPEVF